MGMADPLPPTASLTLRFKRTDDCELTCFLCGRQGCTYEFSYRARGARVTAGAHTDCVEFSELESR